MPDLTGDGVNDLDITTAGSLTTVGGVIFTDAVKTGSGTGGYNTFLAIQDSNDAGASESGFNTTDTPPLDASNPEIDHSKTHEVRLADMVQITVDGQLYYEFRVDLNEANSGINSNLSLDQFILYSSSNKDISALSTLQSQNVIYDMDAGGNVSVLLSDAGSTGSGTDDYAVLVPISFFDGLNPTSTYIYLFTEMGAAGTNWGANATFEEWNLQNGLTLTGLKFEDVNSNGTQDTGEAGIGGVTIFIDTNKNGVWDTGERTTVTASDGSYSFYGVALGQTLWIDEIIPAGSGWVQTTGDHEVITTTGTPGSTLQVDPIGNHIPVPSMNVVKTVTSVTNGDDNGTPLNTADDRVNSAGDIINYLITVDNTGEVALTGINVTDQIEAYAPGAATAVLQAGETHNIGDVNDNDMLDTNEIWSYTVNYTVTQADIDAAYAGNGSIDNVATATSNETPPDSDDEHVPVLTNPDITIVKVVNDVDGDTTDPVVDHAGDIINYRISVTNSGNVTLTGLQVTDTLDPTVTAVLQAGETHIVGDVNDNDIFDVGETWIYAASYTATQADIDAGGNYNTPGSPAGNDVIRNIATADTNQTGPESDDATVPVIQNPDLTIVKVVNDVDGDTSDPVVDHAGDVINYRINVTNSGNVTLTGLQVTDTLDPTVTAVLQAGETHIVGDLDDDDVFDIGETWVFAASYTVTQADIDAGGNYNTPGSPAGNDVIRNIATADTDQTDPESDDATVPVVLTPDLTIVKDVLDVDGDTTDPVVDHAGDIINYRISVTNSGNVTLTNLQVTDTLDPTVTAVLQAGETHIVGDVNDNDVFDIGETWVYAASYMATQADIDAGGNFNTPGSPAGNDVIRNIATADTNQTDPESDDATVPVVQNPDLTIVKVVNDVDGDTTDPVVDHAGDIINYRISVTNSGNVTLTGLQVTDTLDPTVTPVLQAGETHIVGDLDDDDIFDVGETWVFAASYMATQADIDAGGNYNTPGSPAGNEVIRNIATADTLQTNPESDDATVPVVQMPDLTIVKVVNDVDGDTTDPVVDHAGDVINYRISVTNSGNVTLTGLQVTDTLDPTVTPVLQAGETHIVGDLDDDDIFDVGETWVFAASYTVTQADIDARGNYDTPGSPAGNDSIRNIATADTLQTDPESDDATVPVVYTPAVDLEKYVSVTGVAGTYVDADTAALGPQNVNLGAPVFFMVTVANTGNVTLTNPLITDVNTSNGGNTPITLYDGATDTVNASVTSFTGDSDGDGNIDVGETWTFIYSQPFDAGDHVNTATVTTTGVTDSDAAHYFSLVNEGPGVRTPGFWANWTEFWDGNNSNNPKQTGKPGFPEYDLLRLDTNGDHEINGSDNLTAFSSHNGTLGLLIGDYDRDGQQDAGEDILFISLADATRLLTGKEKDMSDGVVKIGRDVVASWLNYLEGNGIGTAGDTNSPQHFINDAVNYLQMFGDVDGGTATNETFDVFSWSHGGVKTGTSLWTGIYPGLDHSGAQIHAALDYYNNTGMTSPGGMTYAHDADDSMFLTALKVYESIV